MYLADFTFYGILIVRISCLILLMKQLMTTLVRINVQNLLQKRLDILLQLDTHGKSLQLLHKLGNLGVKDLSHLAIDLFLVLLFREGRHAG